MKRKELLARAAAVALGMSAAGVKPLSPEAEKPPPRPGWWVIDQHGFSLLLWRYDRREEALSHLERIPLSKRGRAVLFFGFIGADFPRRLRRSRTLP